MRARFLLVAALINAISGVALAGWSAKASATWTYVYVKTDCPGVSGCEASDFNILSDGFESCLSTGGTVPGCFASATANAAIAWSVRGAGAALNGGAYGLLADDLSASGARLSPSLFRITGSAIAPQGNERLQLAVVRFSGTPVHGTVEDMIALGLLSPGDVLFQLDDAQIPASFSFDVDVTGLSDSEIAVFAFGDGSAPQSVPALTSIAVVVMIAGVLLAGGFLIRR